MDVSDLGQYGIIGAFIAQTILWLRYLEHKDDDKVAQLERELRSAREDITELQSQRQVHHERLNRHSQSKANKSSVSREVARIDKRHESMERHRSKNETDS